MILKRREFVIQWRKFGLKRSCILRNMNFWSFSPFSDFYLNFKVIFRLIFLLKSQKGGVFWSTGPRLMTWQAYPGGGWRGARDHRAVTTWHWGNVAGRVWPTQEAHRARQVAGRPRGHVGAHVGRHVWLDLEGERRS